MHKRFLFAICLLGHATHSLPAQSDVSISFNRDVRPILSENCFFCHGQDAGKRKADLRLDTLEGQRESKAVIPGDPDGSSLIARIDAESPDEVMPPPDSNRRLSAQQKAILKQWISEGAPYQKHWAFEAPTRPELPSIAIDTARLPNPIDRFIRAKLSEKQLQASADTDRATLIRRVSLDLVGLPPTLDEVDAFLLDDSPAAYEKVVDRLLKSPHFGERMSLPWLDAARYADTHGYQKDNLRTMWAWRDWVIDALNRNLPFDQFTIEQLAGDLLPDPTLEQRIATGFNRNHRINGEAGAIDEEFRVEYVADRVETTSTVWLGLTVACARCHDHKFDPISQKEYYQLFAFFNNVAENGVDGVEPSAVPSLSVTVPGYREKIVRAERQLLELQKRLLDEAGSLIEEKQSWEQVLSRQLHHPTGMRVWSLIEPVETTSNEKMRFDPLADHSIVVSGPNPLNDTHTVSFPVDESRVTAIRLEALPHASHTNGSLARSFDGNFVLSGFDVQLKKKSQPAQPLQIRQAVADYSQSGWPIEAAIDESNDTGWAVDGGTKRERRQALFIFESPVVGEPGSQLMVRLHYQSKEEQSLIGRFRLATTNLQQPTLESMATLSAPLIAALQTGPDERTEQQHKTVADEFRNRSPLFANVRDQIDSVQRELNELRQQSVTSIMVMEDVSPARETYIHLRGAYDKPGTRVAANVPSSLPPLESDRPLNRLDLARWLVDPANPLTARVAINRYWQMYFGMGLVKTSEDFGTQGEGPSHPELLDWLATEFIRSGWNVKEMQRLIVTSATYRQSSKYSPEALELDPENRYLARGPRFRLPAQLLRDQALSVSGLLVPSVGGPPVKPYQPSGLWEGVAGINSNTIVYRSDTGANLYRRSLYTFWKRAVPPPSMMIFDAADREVCSVKRRVTNTPLQALNLLNDITYVESARQLATRVLKVDALSTEDRLRRMWRIALARQPEKFELEHLADALEAYQASFCRAPSSATSFIEVGESAVDRELDPMELASWTVLAAMILNLDETLTKE